MEDGLEPGFLVLNYAQQMRRRNAEVSGTYSFLTDAAGKPQILVRNINAKYEGTES